jgi:hypothetical protein
MKLMKTTFQLVGLTPLLEWNKKREESAQLRFRCFCKRSSFVAAVTGRSVAGMFLMFDCAAFLLRL